MKEAEVKDEESSFLFKVTHSLYKLVGGRIDRLYPVLADVKKDLIESGLRIGFKPYVSFIVCLSLASVAVSGVIFTLIVLFTTPINIFSLLLVMVSSLLIGTVVFFILYIFPAIQKSRRKERIEHLLPYTTNYMAVLACAGVSPDRILRSTAQKDKRYLLSDEVKLIVSKMDLLGYDLFSALQSEMERTPSTFFSNFLRGYNAVARSGGDLKKYLLDLTRQLMNEKDRKLKEFIDSLGIIGEIYIALLVVFPLFLIIMFSLMAMMGGAVFGISLNDFMFFVTFGLIPIFAIMFIVFVDMVQPGD